MTGDIHRTYDQQATVANTEEYYHSSTDRAEATNNESILEEYSEKAAPPRKQKFYKTKKYWIICSIQTVIITVVAVVLALYVIFPKVAQSIMNKSKIDVDSASISFTKPASLDNAVYSKRDDDLNTTFYMNMGSSLSHTGPFHATIQFHNPINVYYNDTHLGDIFFYNKTKVAGGKGKLNADTPFVIKDENAFAEFSKTMLAVEEFTWTLKGKLDISALSRTATINLDKQIKLKGMNGFPKVQISSFELPGDAPEGGIAVKLGTVLTSPSPIGVQLGTIKMAIGYDGVPLGVVTGQNVNLAEGDNNILLEGVLTPHTDAASLDKVSTLFSNYIAGTVSNTTAVGISSAPDGVNPIRWLSKAFESVNLNVGLTAGAPLKIINGISMGYLDLAFDAANPYSPTINAPNIVANFQMPFGFSLDVQQVSQNIQLGINNTDNTATDYFALLQTPLAPATSDQAAGVIQFGLSGASLAGIPGKEETYNQYTYALTASSNYTFMISGTASTVATTPIGNVTLSGINFTVPTSLSGLQFLNSTPTVIHSLDVVGGTSAGLDLAISVGMNNPADFAINTGDVTLNMGASGVTLGTVTLANLTLARGDNTVAATSVFDARSSQVGLDLLSTFIMGSDNTLDITGSDSSTPIVSLAKALGDVSLQSTLPGLTSVLVQGASMRVAADSIATGYVPIQVTIANPFTAGMSISSIKAANSFQGIPIGNIDQDISSTPYVIGGKSSAVSQDLLMSMSFEPSNVAILFRSLAVTAGLDTTALDALLTLGGLNLEGQQQINGDSSTFAGFNIVDYLKQAMGALAVDLAITSGVSIGDYSFDLTFQQTGVAVAVDESIGALIPVVGQPIVQQIVAGSILGFNTIIMSNVSESSFTVQMDGSISNTGPMDALISFPDPLTVHWQGEVLGYVTMPDIQAKADVGADFNVQGTFTIPNGNTMAAFAAFMINNESFEWQITTETVRVTAIGFTFTNVALDKRITLAGSNGFKNAVTVKSFDLPSNDPAGGITLIVDSTITNPSQIGFNLGGAQFESYFGDVDIGPLASDGAAFFAPKSSSDMVLKGRLIPQTSTEGIVAITTIFGHYLAGYDSSVIVKGVSGSGSSGVPISWLTSAFSTIRIENVILPGPATPPTLIPSVEMKNLQLDFTQDQWAPDTSSTQVEAQLHSPFGFPLAVNRLNMKVKATYDGHDVASLDIPDNTATTGATGIVTTQFEHVPFAVLDKQLFSSFNYLLTLTESVTFGLQGTTNAIAQSAVGTLSLPGVPFNVNTTLAGFNSFGNKLTINSLSVTGATSTYLIITLDITLNNPSQITINVGDINFDVQVPSLGNAVVGKAYIKNAIITPGEQHYTSIMHMGEGVQSLEALGGMLTAYLTGQTVPLLVAGSSTSTPIIPVATGLSQLKLSTAMTGITDGLIRKISVTGDAGVIIEEGIASASITLYNPLDVPFTLRKLSADTFKYMNCDTAFELYQTTIKMASINYELPVPLVIPPKTEVTAVDWPVVFSATAESDPLLFNAILTTIGDLDHTYNVTQHAFATVGDSFHVPDMYYFQNNIPYELTIPGYTDLGTPEELASMLCPSSLPSSLRAASAPVSEAPAATTTEVPATTTEAATTTEEAVAVTTEEVVATVEATETIV